MVSASRILQQYSNCLSETARFLNKSGYAVKSSTVIVRKAKSQVVVSLSEPLYFKDWPYRCGCARKETIDILADVIETIDLEEGKCVRSTLRINYFLPDGDVRIACEAIHYDFNLMIQSQHPVCHAQNSNSIVELPESFPEKVNSEPLARRHQAIRIPTAFVNVGGLFAKITADHLPSQVISDFWKTCKVYIDEIPTHAPNEVFTEIFAGKTLRSYGWYRW